MLPSELHPWYLPDEVLSGDLPSLYQHIGRFMGDRRDEKTGTIPYTVEEFHPDYRLFPCEMSLIKEIIYSSSKYVSSEQMPLIYNAIVMAAAAHQNQYRETAEPYFTHLGEVTIDLIDIYQQDAVSIASGLLHDAVEDTPLTLEFIRENISPDRQLAEEVVETIDGLTKEERRPGMTKEQREEEYRGQIIASFLDNPRVAIIKIRDRLCNMRTVEVLPKSRRLRMIRETEDIIIPVAKRLGMYEAATELDELCLRKLSKKHERLTEAIGRYMRDYFDRCGIETIPEELRSLLGSPIFIQVRQPGAHDIYRGMGEVRQPTDGDFYLNIDIALGQFLNEVPSEIWGEAVMQLAGKFVWLKEYRLERSIDEVLFRREVEEGLTDSLSFKAVQTQGGLRLNINIFPLFAFNREQVPLPDLYYQRAPLVTDRDLTAVTDEVVRRHFHASKKWEVLKERYRKIATGEVATAQLLRQLEPRLPLGYLRVIGIDEKGIARPWPIQSGSTVMDYVRDISPSGWSRLKSVEVNGSPVFFNYILQPDDRIHVSFSGSKQWNPLWIHCFHTDTEGSKRVRRTVKRLLQGEEEKGESQQRFKVLKVGKWRIEQDLSPDSRPLRIGLRRAMGVIHQAFPDTSEEEFLFKVGMGEVSGEVISQVAGILREPNRNVGVFLVYFRDDQPGESAAVSGLVREMGITLLDTGAEVITTQGPSVIKLYVDPDDMERKGEEIRERIVGDRTCQDFGLERIETGRVGDLAW